MRRSVFLLIILLFSLSVFCSEFTVQTLIDSTENYIVTLQYPVFAGKDFDKANADLKNFAVSAFDKTVKEMKEMPDDEFLNSAPYSATTCSVFGSNDYFVSVRFYNESFTGGAHPSHTYYSYNYDFNLDKQVTLKDSGWPASFITKLADYCKKDVISQLTAKDVKDTDMVADGIKPEYASFQVFNASEKGMYITFNEYVVAPYYIGAITVFIPNSEVEKMIK